MQTLPTWIMVQRKLGIINSPGLYSRRCHDTVSPSVSIIYYTLLTVVEYSKLAFHLWTNYLAKRLTAENSKVMILLVHPGAILSVGFLHSTFFADLLTFLFQDGAIRNLKKLPFSPFWIWLLGTTMYPQEQGAFTSVFAVCTPRDNPQISHGVYICPPNVVTTQALAALNEERQRQLYDFTEALLKSIDV